MRTLLLVQPHAKDRRAVKQRVDGSQRAEKAAEGAVDEDRGDDHRHRHQRFPGKQPAKLRAQAFVGDHQRNAALERARGTEPLAECRGDHAVDDEKIQRQGDDHHHQHYVFYNRQPPRPSTFFEFLRGNFIQEFLDEPKGAQKGAHCPPEQRAKEQQYAQQIERHRRGEIVERRLQRPQRTGGDGPGAAVAVQSRHAEFLAVSPIDRSLEKAADIGVVENRRQHLDNAPPSLRAQCAQPRHHPMPMHSMQMKIAF